MEEEKNTNNWTDSENIKLWWILFFVWNIFWLWWIILAVVYYITKQKELSKKDVEAFYGMFNFFISYLIYSIIWIILIFVMVWLFILIIIFILWFIFSIIWLIKHLKWESYHYPLSIRFLKV